MLVQILEQDTFELLEEEGNYRLLFMLNDTAESFLVLEEPKMTGIYEKKWEGKLQASLDILEDGYILSVRQGNSNAFTLRFRGLHLSVQCFNYGEVGHFWVEGHEPLRLLQYQTAVIHDKWFYLGEEYCTEEEIRLASLVEFPPLQCYPSVSEQYRDVPEDPWKLNPKALEYMMEVAAEAGDRKFQKLLTSYGGNPSEKMAKKVAAAMKKPCHSPTIEALRSRMKKEASRYPERTYEKDRQDRYDHAWQWARQLAEATQTKKIKAEVWREEPFACCPDTFPYQVQILVRRTRMGRETTTVVSVWQEERAEE